MKHQQQQKAREMYFQTNLSKSDIAEKLQVNRRTIYQWSVEGDWEKLRASARSMPAILAEKCYYLIAHFTDHLLSRDSFYQSVTKSDVDILFKLTKTVNMLKKGSTVNENMETFTAFLESIQAHDPSLADAVVPHIDTFITGRTASSTINTLDGFTPQGTKPFPEKEIMEKWLDEQDAAALAAEKESNTTPPTATTPQPSGTAPAATTHNEPLNVASPQLTDTDKSKASATHTPLPPASKEKNYKAAFWHSQDKAKQGKKAAKRRAA